MESEGRAYLESIDGVGDVRQDVGMRHSGDETVTDIGRRRGKIGCEYVSIDRNILDNFARCSVKVRAGDFDGDCCSIQGA